MKPHSALALLLALSAAGCAGQSDGVAHDAPELALYADDTARLRSDLPPERAEELRAHVSTLEAAIDSAFPWLARGGPPGLTLFLADGAHYALFAQDHAVRSGSSAFVCPRGEVIALYRQQDWDPLDGPPYPLEPRIRPLAAALVRRRLIEHYGAELEATWIEEGLVRVFVEIAAVEFGEVRHARRQNRERLLDAFLPLYLGDPPVLIPLAKAHGRRHMERAANSAQAWAAVRFLLADPERLDLIDLALRHAAGHESEGESLEDGLDALGALDVAFEEWLLAAVLEELLAAYQHEPTPVDRWEAAAGLRLIANVDLDADANDEQRPRLAKGTRGIVAEHPPNRRFLDAFAEEVALTRASRSQLQAMSRLRKLVSRELTRRSNGYGHPAVEAARRNLSRSLQRVLSQGR